MFIPILKNLFMRQTMHKEMKSSVKKTINFAVKAAVAAGPTAFVIGSDMPVLIGIWVGMVGEIADAHYIKIDKGNLSSFITIALSGASGWISGSAIVSRLLAISGIGLPLGVGVNSLLNALLTKRLGVAFNDMCIDYTGMSTISELAKIARKQLVPLPSIDEIKEVIAIMKNQM